LYRGDTLQQLVNNFADPKVGYVTGKMCYVNPDGSGIADSCGTYMKYENALRTIETRCGSIVGVDGGVDAIRKNLYIEMAPEMLPDFVLPLSVVERGYRVVYEPDAIVSEDALSSSEGEFRMRVRVALRALRAMWHMRRMFNPFRYGLFSFQLFSHKLLRYSIPFVLLWLILSNVFMLRHGGFWLVAFAGQCLFYSSAAFGYILGRLRKRLPAALYFPFYFVLLNCACLVAWVKFLRKKKQTVWAPRTG
jgi:cellulose synthase/poly-beta-1,6-N-acetylglucosamine synthase-like glycosyltransferase